MSQVTILCTLEDIFGIILRQDKVTFIKIYRFNLCDWYLILGYFILLIPCNALSCSHKNFLQILFLFLARKNVEFCFWNINIKLFDSMWKYIIMFMDNMFEK